LISFGSCDLKCPLGPSNLTHASGGELVFQSIYQGVTMSLVSLFAALLGPRAAAAIIDLAWRCRSSANGRRDCRLP